MSSSEHEMEEERSNSLRDVTVMTPELRVRHLSWPDCYLQVCNKRSGRDIYFFLAGGGGGGFSEVFRALSGKALHWWG